MQAVLYTLFIIISITHSQRFDCDNDVAPDGPHTCAEQLDWGKCDASEYDWMLGYCCQSCGTQTCADCDSSAAVTPAPITSITPAPREQYVCDQDVQSGEEYTCAEQKGWDQCMEDWMEGWCCISCPDSCLSQCASPSTTEINASNITNITNITIIMMQPTKPPLTTTQNVFTSMEEEQSMAPYTCDADVVPGNLRIVLLCLSPNIVKKNNTGFSPISQRRSYL